MVTRYLAGGCSPNPGVIPPGLLLDSLAAPAAVAYSSRKLRHAYLGESLQVRRSSDNVFQNIGFTGNDLHTGSLAGFVGSNSGFIVNWYDQSGNGVTAVSTSNLAQPTLVNAGANITLNGRVAFDMMFNGVDDRFLLTPASPITQSQPVTFAIVARWASFNTEHITGGTVQDISVGDSGVGSYQITAETPYTGGYHGGTLDTTTHSIIAVFNHPNSVLYVDGVVTIAAAAGTNQFTQMRIGASTTGPFDGRIAEYMVFFSALSTADIATIRASHQAYWGTP